MNILFARYSAECAMEHIRSSTITLNELDEPMFIIHAVYL